MRRCGRSVWRVCIVLPSLSVRSSGGCWRPGRECLSLSGGGKLACCVRVK